MYLQQWNYKNCVIKYDQTYSPYPDKISIIYMTTLPTVLSCVSTAFFDKSLNRWTDNGIIKEADEHIFNSMQKFNVDILILGFCINVCEISQ